MHTQRFSIVVTAALLLASFVGYAQDESDALRYSYLQPQGTARSLGFGSALGSVGGDFTSLSVNPAGIGVYRRSEFTVTPSFRLNGVEGTYLGNTTSDDAFRFNVSNIGYVNTSAPKGKRYDRADWKSVSFGFGLSRVADFNRRYTYSGVNDSSTATELLSIDANDQYFDGYALDESSLGSYGYYDAYLIDFDTTLDQFVTSVDWRQGVKQMRKVNERGGINEAVISVGGNYREQLLLGATLGFPLLRYRREVTLQETDDDNGIPGYESFTINEALRTTGVGVNLKLGAIYKFTDQFRLGAAIHTPTAYSLSDEFEQSLSASTEGIGSTDEFVTPLTTFQYTLFTPWRAVASATVILGKSGFLTADYEYVDYASARYRFNTTDNQSLAGSATAFTEAENAANDRIRAAYQGASNVRVGAEFRLDNLFLRTGFGYYGSPYQKSDNFKPSRLDASLGIGFRTERSFIDIAYVHSRYESAEQPYALNYEPPLVVTVPSATLVNNLNNVAVTLGFKF